MRLKIGLLADTPSWRMFLQQLGASFETVDARKTVLPDQYSVVIVNRKLTTGGETEMIRTYVREGGAILDCGHYSTGTPTSRHRINWILPSADDPFFSDVWLCDLYTRVRTNSPSRNLNNWMGLIEEGNGWIGVMPFDPPLTDARRKRKFFYTPFEQWPDEEVSAVSKGELRKLLTSMLRWLHHKRCLPFAHLWYFPGTLPNIFLYRLDSDFGTQSQIDALYRLAEKYCIQITWFLHVAAHESWLADFARMQNQEIGVHCYEHASHSSYDFNYRNFARALRLIREVGFNPKGLAAPYGIWNAAIARASEDLGFVYASEFSLDYDNLPSHPLLENRLSGVLQVPIHPICIGNFVRAGVPPNHMIEYYRFMIDKKLSHQEPLAFYHHPTHEHWDVVENMFQYVAEKNIPSLTFGAYASWWNRRSEILFDIYLEGSEIRLVANRESDVYVHVLSESHRSTLIGLNTQWDLKSVCWEDATPPMKAPSGIERIRRPSIRLWQHSIEDLRNRFQQ